MLTTRDMEILEFISLYGGITIKQAYKIFFNGAKYGYDRARKRLKILADEGVIKYNNTWASNERIYYTGKKVISAHQCKLLDVYADMIAAGCEILKFDTEPVYMEGQIRPDGFIDLRYQGRRIIIIIEIDFTHQTDIGKYELLYHTGEIQEDYKGAFPRILIITNAHKNYKSKDFRIEIIKHDLKDLIKIALQQYT